MRDRLLRSPADLTSVKINYSSKQLVYEHMIYKILARCRSILRGACTRGFVPGTTVSLGLAVFFFHSIPPSNKGEIQKPKDYAVT